MMGGGGACAVLAHRMPLPSVDSSSWPIACLSLVLSGRSNVSPLCTFLVMAHRMPLPWVDSSSWPIACLSLALCTFLVMAHRMPLPWVDSSSWPIECLSLGPWARSSSWPIERLSLLWVPPAGQRNIDSNKQFHQLLKRRVTKRPPFVILR